MGPVCKDRPPWMAVGLHIRGHQAAVSRSGGEAAATYAGRPLVAPAIWRSPSLCGPSLMAKPGRPRPMPKPGTEPLRLDWVNECIRGRAARPDLRRMGDRTTRPPGHLPDR